MENYCPTIISRHAEREGGNRWRGDQRHQVVNPSKQQHGGGSPSPIMFLPGDVRRIKVYHAMWSGGLWNSSPALVAVIWGGNSTGEVRGKRRREEGGFFIFTRKKWEWSQFCIYYCFPLVCVSAWRGLEPKILAKNVSNLLPASILVPVPSHLISGNDSLWFPKCGNWFCHSLAFPRFGN